MRKGRTFARDAPNRRMTKHRAEENMTSIHSAKETVKWQLTEDETSAKKPTILRNEREWTHARPKGWLHRERPRNEEPLAQKLQTNRLSKPLSNRQVSMTPESQRTEIDEPHSYKQKAQ